MASDDQPRWRGINHLALVTDDMDTTVRFYHGVLGMPLVTTLRAGPMRHYFFEMAPGNTVAFFEVKDIVTFAAAAGVPDPRKAQFDHLSFNLPDEEALHLLQRRLKANGCGVTDVIDHGVMRSIYFMDPNGLALEASWWAVDPTGRPVDYDDERLFADPDPVPAVAELRAGPLKTTPAVALLSDEVVDPA